MYIYIYIQYIHICLWSISPQIITSAISPASEACGDAGQTAAGAYLHQHLRVAQLLRILAGDRGNHGETMGKPGGNGD